MKNRIPIRENNCDEIHGGTVIEAGKEVFWLCRMVLRNLLYSPVNDSDGAEYYNQLKI